MKKSVFGTVTICAGAPLLALGMGTATAWADTTESSTDPSTTQQSNDGSLAISVGGITVVQTGKSVATTVGPNLAIAYNNSQAGALFGIGNVVIATNDSVAGSFGKLNAVYADNGSTADALGDLNFVSATNNSHAAAGGRFNTVTANDGSTVEIWGDANRVTARCGGSVIDPLDSPPETVISAQSNRIVTIAPCARDEQRADGRAPRDYKDANLAELAADWPVQDLRTDAVRFLSQLRFKLQAQRPG